MGGAVAGALVGTRWGAEWHGCVGWAWVLAASRVVAAGGWRQGRWWCPGFSAAQVLVAHSGASASPRSVLGTTVAFASGGDTLFSGW